MEGEQSARPDSEESKQREEDERHREALFGAMADSVLDSWALAAPDPCFSWL